MDTNPTPPKQDQSRRKLSYLFLGIGCILLVIAYLIGISDNPPGIASMFLGGFLVILGLVYRFRKSENRTPARELLYWSPRVLCIAFAVFTSMFALDVFGDGRGFWETTGALFMHLIATSLILIVLAVSWRREWIGGVFYIGLAALYIVMMGNKPLHWSALVLIAGPLVLMGALFLLNWYHRDTLRGGSIERATQRWLLPAVVVLGFVIITVLYFALLPGREYVTFRVDAPAAQQVFVTGSFNNWIPRQYPLSKQPQGQWQTTISLPPGRYEYKFIVDSEWVHDVNNPHRVQLQSPLHGYNSVINVGSQDSLASTR